MKRLVPIIVIAVLAAGAAHYAYVRLHGKRGIEGPVLTARFLDADFGNAVTLRTPDAKIIVIDPASGRGVTALVDLLRQEHARDITVVLTNPSTDRVRALAKLQEAVGVSRVIRPELGTATEVWKQMLARRRCGPIAETALAGGDTLKLAPRIALEALGPVREKAHGGPDGSLVFRVRFGAKSIFFASQMATAGEADLISSGRNLTGSVLVVGDRGRYRGVSLELLSVVRPEIIVISSSARPAASMLTRLGPHNTGAALYRTYKDGIIEIDTDGRSIQVETGGGAP